MSHNTILLLTNPKGNRKRIDKILGIIIPILESKGIAFHHATDWPQHINDHKQVWLIGGDGTINYLINHYKGISIPIVLFPGGTGNDVSWQIYGGVNISKQVEQVLNGNEYAVDGADVNSRSLINGIGIGFDGEVIRSMGIVRFLGGHLGYYVSVIKNILTYKEKQMRIVVDGRIYEGKFLLALICNTKRMGGGFMVSPESEINDGKLNLILCQPLSIYQRLKNLPLIQKGKHLEKKFITHLTASDITIECNGDVYAQMDGELLQDRKFNVQVKPGKYLFMR